MRLLSLVFALFLFALPAKAAESFATLAKGGAGGWLNVTRPLTEADMTGRVVVLDFWTYGCINCMQVVPDLEYLEEKYGDKLLVIGVHSAKFQGEKGSERILAAAKRFGLKHPVINDSDFAIWNSFNIEAWPSFVVLGPDGKDVAKFVGEGNRANLDRAINSALPSRGPSTPAIATLLDDTKAGDTLSFPSRLAYAKGVIYVADSGHNRIAGFKNGKQVLSIAGFNNPRGIALVGDTLYIADTDNHMIRALDLKTKALTNVAGTGKMGRARNAMNAPALKTPLASPWDVEPLPDGRIAIAMAGTHQLWVYDTATKTVSVLAGTGAESIDDGAAIGTASLSQPSGLSVAGNTLFFVDAESSALRELENDTVDTLIGTGLFDFGLKDGTYPEALMQHPQGLFADDKRIVIADTYNNVLRVYDRVRKQLTTVALSGDTLNEPGDVIVVDGNALVADTNHHAIKSVDLKTGVVSTLPLQ